MSNRNIAVMKFSALGDIAACLQFIRSLDPNTYIITSPLGRSFLEDEFSNFLVLEDKSIKSHIKLISEIRKHDFHDIIDLQGNDRCRLLSKLCRIASPTITHNGYDPNSKYQPFSSLVQEISNKVSATRHYQPKPENISSSTLARALSGQLSAYLPGNGRNLQTFSISDLVYPSNLLDQNLKSTTS